MSVAAGEPGIQDDQQDLTSTLKSLYVDMSLDACRQKVSSMPDGKGKDILVLVIAEKETEEKRLADLHITYSNKSLSQLRKLMKGKRTSKDHLAVVAQVLQEKEEGKGGKPPSSKRRVEIDEQVAVVQGEKERKPANSKSQKTETVEKKPANRKRQKTEKVEEKPASLKSQIKAVEKKPAVGRLVNWMPSAGHRGKRVSQESRPGGRMTRAQAVVSGVEVGEVDVAVVEAKARSHGKPKRSKPSAAWAAADDRRSDTSKSNPDLSHPACDRRQSSQCELWDQVQAAQEEMDKMRMEAEAKTPQQIALAISLVKDPATVRRDAM